MADKRVPLLRLQEPKAWRHGVGVLYRECVWCWWSQVQSADHPPAPDAHLCHRNGERIYVEWQ